MPTGTTLDITKEWLYDQHVNQKKSCCKIAKELGCDKKCIFERLKKFDIKRVSVAGKPCANLIGKRFDLLVVLSYEGKNVNNAKMWKCVCDCGNETTIVQTSLTTRHTTSCGCKKSRRPANNKCVGGILGQLWGSILRMCYNVVNKHQNRNNLI